MNGLTMKRSKIRTLDCEEIDMTIWSSRVLVSTSALLTTGDARVTLLQEPRHYIIINNYCAVKRVIFIKSKFNSKFSNRFTIINLKTFTQLYPKNHFRPPTYNDCGSIRVYSAMTHVMSMLMSTIIVLNGTFLQFHYITNFGLLPSPELTSSCWSGGSGCSASSTGRLLSRLVAVLFIVVVHLLPVLLPRLVLIRTGASARGVLLASASRHPPARRPRTVTGRRAVLKQNRFERETENHKFNKEPIWKRKSNAYERFSEPDYKNA